MSIPVFIRKYLLSWNLIKKALFGTSHLPNGTETAPFTFQFSDLFFIEFLYAALITANNFSQRLYCPFTTRQQIIPASGLVTMPALNLPWFCQKFKLKCLKTPDFYFNIPDNWGTVPDKRGLKTDFWLFEADYLLLHPDRGIRTFTLKSPCPDGKNPQPIVL